MHRPPTPFVILPVLFAALAALSTPPAFTQRRSPPSTAPMETRQPDKDDQPRAVPRLPNTNDQPTTVPRQPDKPAAAGEREESQRAVPRKPDQRAEPREPARPASRDANRSARTFRRERVVFVGGYFYDPFFGRYPWWARLDYPYSYYPIFDNRAIVRVMVTPTDAAVYVDGFYAGIVDDFNGFFQGLPLPPGGHEIVFYLDGYRTARHRVYLARGSTFRLRDALVWLPPGVISEPPTYAPPLPPPPDGSYAPPRTSRAAPPPVATPAPATRIPYGTLSLRIQPADAEVWIDGERWWSSSAGQFVVALEAGGHRLEVVRSGYRTYTSDIRMGDGETLPINVSLSPESRH